MICIKNAKSFCGEDLSKIENYELAINDKTQTWDCHHRLETDLGLSRQELIDTNRYYNVEAKYLIFLTHSEHCFLHNRGKVFSEEHKRNLSVNHANVKGENSPMYGKSKSEETKRKISESLKGHTSPRKGVKLSDEQKQKIRESTSKSIKEWWAKRKNTQNKKAENY